MKWSLLVFLLICPFVQAGYRAEFNYDGSQMRIHVDEPHFCYVEWMWGEVDARILYPGVPTRWLEVKHILIWGCR